MKQKKNIAIGLSIWIFITIFALNITFVSAVTDATETVEIAANDGAGFNMQAYSDEPMTVRWTCSKSVKVFIVEDSDYSDALNDNIADPMAQGEGATGEITATATEFAQYWAAFHNDNAESVTVEVTYNIGGFNWALLAGILVIIGFAIVGTIAALKGYVFHEDSEGRVSWRKSS